MKILFVDDDMAILMMVLKSLEQYHSFQVKIVDNIDEAIKSLRTQQFDVVVSDYMMDNVDDGILLEKINEVDNLKHIPVIFLTAINDDKIIADMMSKGAKGVILKPFIPKELGSRILDIMNLDES